MHLRVLTWNLGCADRAVRHASTSQPADLEGIAGTIAQADPDIVTLQEVNVAAGHHRALVGLLDGHRVVATGTGDRARAILARTSIRETRIPRAARPPRACGMMARAFTIGGGRGADVVVGSIHSPARARNTTLRVAGHRRLAAWVRETGPQAHLLLAGDFNVDPATSGFFRHMRRLTERRIGPLDLMRLNPATHSYVEDQAAIDALLEATVDIGREAGPTCGLPRHWRKHLIGPLGLLAPVVRGFRIDRERVRIDLVLGSPTLRRVSARVVRRTGPHAPRDAAAPKAYAWMDHDPLVAEIEVPERRVRD